MLGLPSAGEKIANRTVEHHISRGCTERVTAAAGEHPSCGATLSTIVSPASPAVSVSDQSASPRQAAPVDAIAAAVTAPPTASAIVPQPPVAASKKSQKTARSQNRRERGWYDASARRQQSRITGARAATATNDQVRVSHQRSDGQDARPRSAADAARPRRRGDRVNRALISLIGGAAAWPLAARGQRAMPVVGFLHHGPPEELAPLIAGFRKGLSETGYVEGQSRGDRVSVGQQSNRSPAGTGGRSGTAPGGRYRHPTQHAGCARRQGCHREHSDRVRRRHRSGASGSSAELRPAGRERHRYRPARLGA
jgi:hypothetical protein